MAMVQSVHSTSVMLPRFLGRLFTMASCYSQLAIDFGFDALFRKGKRYPTVYISFEVPEEFDIIEVLDSFRDILFYSGIYYEIKRNDNKINIKLCL